MSSKKSQKKGTGASSSSEQQTKYEGCKCEGCYKHGPLSGAAHHAPFDARFAAIRRGLEKLVKGMPARLLKPGGSGGPSLEKCLKGLYTLKIEEDKDHQLMEAHALSHFDEARPILAAGLYSDCQECQTIAVSCFQGYVKDGDLTRGFPSYCKPFERHMELLESESWEVVGQTALSISSLCSAPFLCPGCPHTLHRLRFCKLGAVDKMIELIARPPIKRWHRSYTREMAQMELCYALTPLLRDFPVAGGLQAPEKVLATPELIPRVVELVSCPDSDGEVQRIALMCLVVVAELSRKTAEAVMRAGGKEAAEKALKAPFAGQYESRDQETKRRATELLKALMAWGPTEPPKKTLPSLSEVERLSVKELKALLQQHGVGHQECLEKSDLQRKVRALIQPPTPEPHEARKASGAASTSSGSEAAAAPQGSSEAPVDKENLPGPPSVASLSTKELREELKRLNVSTAGCLERQDLVDKLTSALQERGGAGSTPSASTCASNGELDPDSAPSLEVALPAAEASAEDTTFSALMDFLGSATNTAARLAADQMLAQLLRSGELAGDISLERAIGLITRGKSTSVRLCGLKVMFSAIDESPHQLRQAMASKGVLKGTVRLLHDQDRSTRLQVMDVLCLFAEVPALAPKIWAYGAMGSVLEEFTRPPVLAAIEAQSSSVVDPSRTSEGVARCLYLLALMLVPSCSARLPSEGGPILQPEGRETSDTFTYKVARWLVKTKIHEQIGKLMVIARVTKGKRTWQGRSDVRNDVVCYGVSILKQLLAFPELADKVLGLPGLAESMVYFVEQWKASEPECNDAARFLTLVRAAHKGTLAKFCTRDEMLRLVKALKASVKNPDPSMADHRARADLLKTLEGDLRKERLSDTLPFWWESLKTAPDTDAAERIVKHVLECPDGRPHVVNEQLYRSEFWPVLASCAVRAGPDRRFLLITFVEAFNLYHEPGGIPLEPGVKRLWGIPEPLRSRVTLQLLEKGVVRTLEQACQVDETAVHVMGFYQYVAQRVDMGGSVARALLTDADLMPFLLRFSLLEQGCRLGMAMAKLAVKALLSLSPPRWEGGQLPDSQFALTIASEPLPGRPANSLRYNYHDGCIYVGPAMQDRAVAVGPTFLTSGREMILEYNRQNPHNPLNLKQMDEFEPPVGAARTVREPPPPKRKKCALCSKSPAKAKCARCRKTVYCGKDCQLADWSNHKQTCQPRNA